MKLEETFVAVAALTALADLGLPVGAGAEPPTIRARPPMRRR